MDLMITPARANAADIARTRLGIASNGFASIGDVCLDKGKTGAIATDAFANQGTAAWSPPS